eukprot:3661065-Prymnesium_polylepis.1
MVTVIVQPPGDATGSESSRRTVAIRLYLPEQRRSTTAPTTEHQGSVGSVSNFRWCSHQVPIHGTPAYYKWYAGGRTFPGRQVTRPPRGAARAW